jgi:hypothetical protein
VFQAVNQSAWQHPGIAWIAGAPLLAVGIVRLRNGRRFWLWCFLVLELELLVDAWLGGALAPKLPTSLATLTMAFSIIFGDLRFFYLVELASLGLIEREGRGVRSVWRPLRVALPVSFLVPGLMACLHERDPVRYDGTFVYLVYELGLLLVITAFCFLRARNPRPQARAYVHRLILVECVQYVLWALADMLILLRIGRGGDLGWLLRLVPNAIYYAAFVPIATFNPPSEP